jgi:hypothetical protein
MHAEGAMDAPTGVPSQGLALRVLDFMRKAEKYMTQAMVVMASMRLGLIRVWLANAAFYFM